ncbi:MAG: cellulase family glycosylhydrolase [Nitrospirae bacterium]|nr:cellulase family glycosylhydrolase [Nitrospirota bacterium]
MKNKTHKTCTFYSFMLIVFSLVICWHSSAYAYVKAVHYWGGGWPLNFWSALELDNVDEDMELIKKDGFNTIILVVPWSEFQPGIKGPTYDKVIFDRLETVIRKADKHGVKVILRMSYLWDYAPGKELTPLERTYGLLARQLIYDAWLDYFREVYKRVKLNKNFLFAFISWEDFMLINNMTSYRLSDRAMFSKGTGFHDFLKEKYQLKDLSALYGEKFTSYDDVIIPDRKDPAFRVFFEFYDYFLVERLLKGAQKFFPGLSLEIRVDADPVFGPKGDAISVFKNRFRHLLGGLLRPKEEVISVYTHEGTYNLPGTDVVTTYYSVATGAENRGDETTAKRALEIMQYYLKKVKEKSQGKNLFIDQFNFIDNTPYFSHNTKLKPSETDKFLEGSASVLKQYTTGYSLWGYRDYEANYFYNPAFQLGLKGWRSGGKVRVASLSDGKKAAVVSDEGYVSQFVPNDRVALFGIYKEIHLCFRAKALNGNPAISINVKNHPVITEKLTTSPDKFCHVFPMQSDYDITFEAHGGDVAIYKATLYSHVQKIGLYDPNGNPSPSIKAIRQLNGMLK